MTLSQLKEALETKGFPALTVHDRCLATGNTEITLSGDKVEIHDWPAHDPLNGYCLGTTTDKLPTWDEWLNDPARDQDAG